MADTQRWFFCGIGLIGIVLVAALIGYVVEPPKTEPCSSAKYAVGERPGCVVVP